MSGTIDLPARPLGLARAVLAGVGTLPLVGRWLLRAPSGAAARRLERRFYRRVAAGFGLSVRAEGVPLSGGGTLFVANHVSWADILVLGSLLDARFVAKDEVAGWPLIGRWAARAGVIFVDRGRRSDAHGQAANMRAAFGRGEDVILFPEGTTSDGLALLPFRSSLFAAAGAAAHIQPVAIVYRDRAGRPLSDVALAELAWTHGEPLGDNVRAFARMGAAATAYFLPPIPDEACADRKQAAALSRSAIEAACASARDG